MTFPKNNPSFDLGAKGSFSFPTPMYIYIWSISLSAPDNIEMSLTTWISLMPISVNWLYRCFTYLGGRFIQLTTHPFFILNIAKVKFEKMSKLTKLDWIFFFFFAGYYIRQRNLLVQTYYEHWTDKKFFFRHSKFQKLIIY